MDDTHLGIYPLRYEDVTDPVMLSHVIYPNMQKNYYWSDDFSPEFYIAQAKAGFIAVTDILEGKELLLPEIQFSYAVLHFENLHISKKVAQLLRREKPKLHVTSSSEKIDMVIRHIQHYHKECWLTPLYADILHQTRYIKENFQLIVSYIEKNGTLAAGEIGYIIGDTYTSLSGFSSKERIFKNYGTTQLVLLAQYLQENGFAFWNLGQSYMPYKFQLGAKQYERHSFLKLWFENI